jgi:ABC exporter DevB family membrane fusion protein
MLFGEDVMKKQAMTLAVASAVGITSAALMVHRSRAAGVEAKAPDSARPASRSDVTLVSGPGRIEPVSEDIQVSAEIAGRLKSVEVEEGDRVRRGQVLAVLNNDDYRAQVASAAATLCAREADLRKVQNGARTEERQETLAAVNEAQAVMENARLQMERRQRLNRDGVVSREEAENYEREYKVAKARYDAAAQHFALIDDPSREEDVARAQADVALVNANLDEARARYQKTFVRSPIDGVVLRKHHRPGESVTVSSSSPDPIVTLGDTCVVRVRMDVDEDDVARIGPGDRAYVTADAFGTRKFWGHVVRVGEEMGPKNVRTDEPTERVDKKILETLIQLDDGRQLPIGLRMDSFVLTREK